MRKEDRKYFIPAPVVKGFRLWSGSTFRSGPAKKLERPDLSNFFNQLYQTPPDGYFRPRYTVGASTRSGLSSNSSRNLSGRSGWSGTLISASVYLRKPVPAGTNRPTMTFSFRPCR